MIKDRKLMKICVSEYWEVTAGWIKLQLEDFDETRFFFK
jgi:hypothetical protein